MVGIAVMLRSATCSDTATYTAATSNLGDALLVHCKQSNDKKGFYLVRVAEPPSQDIPIRT
jgi:hypothetical protein